MFVTNTVQINIITPQDCPGRSRGRGWRGRSGSRRSGRRGCSMKTKWKELKSWMRIVKWLSQCWWSTIGKSIVDHLYKRKFPEDKNCWFCLYPDTSDMYCQVIIPAFHPKSVLPFISHGTRSVAFTRPVLKTSPEETGFPITIYWKSNLTLFKIPGSDVAIWFTEVWVAQPFDVMNKVSYR